MRTATREEMTATNADSLRDYLQRRWPDGFPHGQAAAVALRAATDLGFLERYHRVNAGDGKHQRANETYVPIATAGD